MSRTIVILAAALGIGLSAAVAQEVRKKDESPPAKTTSESGPQALSSPPSVSPSRDPESPSPPRGRRDMKEKIREYAEKILKQHDKNRSGVLEKDEWSTMPERWQAADRNGDGIITLDELIAQFMPPDQLDAERAASSPRSTTPRRVRSLPPTVSDAPSWPPTGMPPAPGTLAPPTPAFGPAISSGSTASMPEKPIDPRASLVSVQLVMVELVPEAGAKVERESSGTASSGVAVGQAILRLDLTTSSEVILGELRKQGMRGRLEVLCRLQLTAADQQMSSLHSGQSEPQITGVMLTQFGQTNNVQYTNTGFRVEIQPRVADRVVSLKINLNDSRLGRAEEGTPISVPAKGEAIRAARVHQLTLQTTVNVPDGQTVVLTGLNEEIGPRKRQLMVLLCPRIVPLTPNEAVRPVGR